MPMRVGRDAFVRPAMHCLVFKSVACALLLAHFVSDKRAMDFSRVLYMRASVLQAYNLTHVGSLCRLFGTRGLVLMSDIWLVNRAGW